MFKKAITFLLIFAMLVPFTAAAAVDEPSATPTVEEILSEYHRKAFEAQTQGDSDSASTWSRRSNDGKTLEQETVDTLTEAGYEAYNVTADNYDTLEAELKTDFANLGLDPEGSYIIVIHGEEETPANPDGNNGATPYSVPEMEQDDLFGDSSFLHTYDGKTYLMRYVTITAADKPDYARYEEYDLLNNESDASVVESFFNTLIGVGLDEMMPEQYIGTVLSMFGINFVDIPSVINTTLTLEVRVNWTRVYTEVYDSSQEEWYTALYVDRVRIATAIEHNYYDPSEDGMVETQTPDHVTYKDAEFYDNIDWRKNAAIYLFQGNDRAFSRVGVVKIYYRFEENTEHNLLIVCANLDGFDY